MAKNYMLQLVVQAEDDVEASKIAKEIAKLTEEHVSFGHPGELYMEVSPDGDLLFCKGKTKE